MPTTWPRHDLTTLLGVEHPILLSPMAGSGGPDLAVAVAGAGGLGALPCAMLDDKRIRAEILIFRQQASAPVNLNFFCHTPPAPDDAAQARWRAHLDRYYRELELDPNTKAPVLQRAPFDEAKCVIVEELKPDVVSFHFGLPAPELVDRVRAAGSKIIASATTVAEARWLEDNGADAIIAQGNEAGGHRGVFLDVTIATQPGTFALVPQVVDAVSVPVIAAGGIADGRGIAAAFALGASGVQVGTAFLRTPEALSGPHQRAALATSGDADTALTNIFSGRPARGIMNRVMRDIGPISDAAPAFPTAGGMLAPLKAKAEAEGRDDFTQLWAGQAVGLARAESAAAVMQRLIAEARTQLGALSG